VADGVGVLGVAKSPEHDAAGVARPSFCFERQKAVYPLLEVCALGSGWLLGLLGWHLTTFKHLGDLLPDLRAFSDSSRGFKLAEINISLGTVLGVAFIAVTYKQWSNFSLIGSLERFCIWLISCGCVP